MAPVTRDQAKPKQPQKRTRILKFKKPGKPAQDQENLRLKSLIHADVETPLALPSDKPHRKIAKVPFKVLDAPQLQDDFYLNLVDWSSTNVLAVGLNGAVYIWSASNSQVKKLCEVPDNDAITSVNWS